MLANKQHARYEALKALGFKCLCGETRARELHFINSHGLQAHRMLTRLGYLYERIARDYLVRASYSLKCSACMRARKLENKVTSTLDSVSSKL
jgi:hypothetical protein